MATIDNSTQPSKSVSVQLVGNPTRPFVRADYFQLSVVSEHAIAISGYQLDYHAAVAETTKPEPVDATESAPTMVGAYQVLGMVMDIDAFQKLREVVNQVAEKLGVK